ESIQETSKALAESGYFTYNKRGDLYCVFVEKGFQLLKQNGFISFIMPNKWLQAGYGANLRSFLLEKNLIKLIDFGDFQIFDGATTYPCIFIAENVSSTKTFSVSVLQSAKELDFVSNVSQVAEEFKTENFGSDTWVISSNKENNMLTKFSKKYQTLNSHLQGQSYRGILTGLSEAFLIDEGTKQEIISQDSQAADILFPFLQGRDVKPYSVAAPSNYLILFEKGFTKSQIGDCTEEDRKSVVQ